MKRLSLTIVVALVFGVASHAEAGFLSFFTGNTVFGLDNTSTETSVGDGIVNFAIYENTDGDWTDDGAFSGPDLSGVSAASAAAKYVYMYQVVNADINPPESIGGVDEDIDSFLVPIFNTTFVIGAGGFSGFAFNESGVGATGPAGNLQLGTNSVTSDGITNNAEDSFGDKTPTENGVALDASALVASDGFAGTEQVDFSLLNLPGVGTVAALEWQFSLDAGGVDRGLLSGEYSSVLYYTSDVAAQYNVGHLTDGGNTFGDIPTVPGPGGLALVLAGLPGMLGLGWYQRRRKSAA